MKFWNSLNIPWIQDEQNHGKPVIIKFCGKLQDEQMKVTRVILPNQSEFFRLQPLSGKL
jgi:hypothetical protein